MQIDGPAGALEARYDPPGSGSGRQAVLCHPHPQYGGSLHDGVLDILARVLLDAGIGVLRFNFRGVGGSAGRYDGGEGELADLQAAAAWLQQQYPGDELWACGYSFGAWVTWRALDAGLHPSRVILLAPPVGPMSFPPPAVAPPAMPVDVIAGTDDAFIDSAALAELAGATVHRLDGADHFFGTAADALQACLARIVAS